MSKTRWSSLEQLQAEGNALLAKCEQPPYGHWYTDVVPVCLTRREFIHPSAFGWANNLYQLGSQQYGALFVVSLLLLNRHETHRAKAGMPTDTEIYPNELIGLWAGEPIVMAHITDRKEFAAGENLHHYARRAFTDLTPAAYAILHADKYMGYTPRPPAYRAILHKLKDEEDDDLRWLSPAMVERLYRIARTHTTDFVERMRAWVLRQKLTDETRRHLGGRPGRLLERKKKQKHREHHRIRPRPDADQDPR